MSNKIVSVIIPTYNSAQLLHRALEALVRQTYKDWEAIVVDNTSTDNTEEVVSSFCDKRINLYKINNNGIIAVSRNRAIQLAKGYWLAFLDADDWWTPDKLEISVRELLNGSDIVYHDLWRKGIKSYNPMNQKIQSRFVAPPARRNLLLYGNALLNSSVVVRRDLILEICGLDENERLVAAEDYECWLRLANITNRFRKISGTYGYYWIGNTNTSSAARTLICLNELRDKYLGKVMEAEGVKSIPPWVSFALAKANFQLKKYFSANQELERIIKGSEGNTKSLILKCSVLRVINRGMLIMK